jgi:hypothetical protein
LNSTVYVFPEAPVDFDRSRSTCSEAAKDAATATNRIQERRMRFMIIGPNLSANGEADVEIRKVMDLEDFGDEFTPNPEIAKMKITEPR